MHEPSGRRARGVRTSPRRIVAASPSRVAAPSAPIRRIKDPDKRRTSACEDAGDLDPPAQGSARPRPNPSLARPPRSRAAGSRNPPRRPRTDHRAGRQRQDDHAHRAAWPPPGARRRAGAHRRDDVQPRCGGGAAGAHCGAPDSLRASGEHHRGAHASCAGTPGPAGCRRARRPGGRARAAAARGPAAVHGWAIAGCSATPGRWHARYPPLSVEGRGASSSGGRAVGADRLPVPPRGSPCARLRRSGRGRRRPARLGPSTPHALAGPLQSRLRG